jgi:hypothetical protein
MKGTITVDGVILEFAFVAASVLSRKFPLAVLYTIIVIPFVFATTWPYLNPLSLLLVLEPHPPIHTPIEILKFPKPMGLIILPIAFINISIGMDKPAMTVCLIVEPVSLVAGTILPYLDAEAMSLLALPLPVVDGTRGEFDWFPEF